MDLWGPSKEALYLTPIYGWIGNGVLFGPQSSIDGKFSNYLLILITLWYLVSKITFSFFGEIFLS